MQSSEKSKSHAIIIEHHMLSKPVTSRCIFSTGGVSGYTHLIPGQQALIPPSTPLLNTLCSVNLLLDTLKQNEELLSLRPQTLFKGIVDKSILS